MNGRPLLVLALALWLGAGTAGAASPGAGGALITVTTTADGVTTDNLCSLREAVISANTDQAVGGCAAGSGADTIVFGSALPLPAVVALSTVGAGEDAALSGDLDLAGYVTIQGPAIIDGNQDDRVFHVLPGSHATLSGLTIRNGDPGGGIAIYGALTASNLTITLNQGNGLLVDGGSAALADVDVTDNSGAGIASRNQAVLTFERGEVRNNGAGGISSTASRLTLTDLTIAGNLGTGIANTGVTSSVAKIDLCEITGNTATNGGGVANTGIAAVMEITRSAIAGNTASMAGGGVFNAGNMTLRASLVTGNHARAGGGIDHFGGTLEMVNTTLSGNSAADNGGGLYNLGPATLEHVTFSGNTANGAGGSLFNDEAPLSIGNSVFGGQAGADNCVNSAGQLTSLGHNLDHGATCGFDGPGDLAADPLLGPLHDNGGPTFTHALLAGSPAINHADPVTCPPADQRGVVRPQGNGCDSGAYEAIGSQPGVTHLPLVFR